MKYFQILINIRANYDGLALLLFSLIIFSMRTNLSECERVCIQTNSVHRSYHNLCFLKESIIEDKIIRQLLVGSFSHDGKQVFAMLFYVKI